MFHLNGVLGCIWIGIGGRILGYRHHISARVGEKRFALTVIFSRELTVSFNLLGRDNFFRQFLVTFDERHHIVRLHPRASDQRLPFIVKAAKDVLRLKHNALG